jgi:hypothetical protein
VLRSLSIGISTDSLILERSSGVRGRIIDVGVRMGTRAGV